MLLKNSFTGRRSERIPAEFLNTLANFWNDLQVQGGALSRREDGRFTQIIVPGQTSDSILASFLIKDTVGTLATMEPGTFFRDTLSVAIVDLPATIQCGTDLRTWIQYDTNIGTAQWQEGTAVPASAGTIETYPVHAIACDGTTIASVHHEHPANFHTWSPATVEGTTGTWITLGVATEHGTAADTAQWTANGTTGLKKYCFDFAFDETTGDALYGFKRLEIYDKEGRLTSCGTEGRYTIDNTVDHADL